MAWFTSPKLGAPPMNQPPLGKRNPSPNAVFTGEVAVPRDSGLANASLTPSPPPSVTALASSGVDAAKKAAERQRKRAAAGVTLLSAKPPAGATANLQAKSLIGY